MATLEQPKPLTPKPEHPVRLQPTMLDDLRNERSIAIATIALKNGSEPKEQFLSLTNEALKKLANKYPDINVMVYQQQSQEALPIKSVIEMLQSSSSDREIGLPYLESTAKALQAMKKALLPDGATMRGMNAPTLDGHSFSQALSPRALLAAADFRETLKKCELPRQQYDAWIHRYKAVFGSNPSELRRGAWLQITYRHLKHLKKTNPAFAVMCRDEQLPTKPSQRWVPKTSDTALYIENEARKNDPEISKRPGKELTRFYVYCADRKAALEISKQKPGISHSLLALYDRVQTLKTFQGAALAFSFLATAVSSLFQEAVTENVRKFVPPKEPLPVVKPLEEAEQIPRLALKPQVESPSAVDNELNKSSTISPTNAGFRPVPNPLRTNKVQR
jgi:hypothetical protein